MNIARPIGAEIDSVEFRTYKSNDIKRISVKEITNPVLFDALGHPNPNGLYDAALGPMGSGSFSNTLCSTCRLDDRFCPGHFGHISLPIHVFNPAFFPAMYSLLRSLCVYCHKFRLNAVETHKFQCKLTLIKADKLIEAQRLDELEYATDMSPQQMIEVQKEFLEATFKNSSSSTNKEYAQPSIPSASRVSAEHACFRALMKLLLSRRKCDHCDGISPTFRKHEFSVIFENPLPLKSRMLMETLGKIRPGFTPLDSNLTVSTKRPKTDNEGNARPMSTLELRSHIQRLFDNEKPILEAMFGLGTHPDLFFFDVLPVTPTKFRPPSKMGEDIHENVQNELLTKILTTSLEIRNISSQLKKIWACNEDGTKENEDVEMTDPTSEDNIPNSEKVDVQKLTKQLTQLQVLLQTHVNSYFDSSKNPVRLPQGKEHPPGIKQILEKKEGLFRKHMMGKRVNFAARSVISPDPYIRTNEIGVPPVFAKKLTYPEPVTSANVHILRQAVINGPEIWPGATHVQMEDGSLMSLAHCNLDQRTAIANQLLTPAETLNLLARDETLQFTNKKVLRHLRNGDLLILNRQPTLHKASMMAHKARVLQGEKTIRMHYANCNSYNADFDGDEMNLHFPQNELARSEALNLVLTDQQYLVPTSGEPLRGLIQDHVVSGVWMTLKDSFYSREEYHQLIYTALDLDSTAMVGKRVMLLPPAIKVSKEELWTGKQIISTLLENLQPPNTEKLFFESKCKIKSDSPTNAEDSKVIVAESYLCTGILDKSQFGATSFGLVHCIYEVWGAETAGDCLSMLGRLFTRHLQMRGFSCGIEDLILNSKGEKARKQILIDGQNIGRAAALEFLNLDENTSNDSEELYNRMLQVVRDSEKLGGLDASYKNKLAPLRSAILDATLPHGLYQKFPFNQMQTMTSSGAKGSNVNVSQISCLLGQQELEGKRVPLMISGKSLPSFPALCTDAIAGGFVANRFLTGILPQEYFFHCMAGREGLIDTAVKTSRSGYLQRCLIKHMEGLQVHYDMTVRDSDNSLIQFNYGEDSLSVTKQTFLDKFKFNIQNSRSFIARMHLDQLVDTIDTDTAPHYRKKQLKKPHKYLDPRISKFHPGRYLGSVSDAFSDELEDYIKKNPDSLLGTKSKSMSAKDFRSLMYLRYQTSLVDPGEMVGTIAGQSIGEPSTQMTLNTFHFAGFGAKNVTLGIPRLREIVMTASQNIETPTMAIPLKVKATPRVLEMCKAMTRVSMSDIVDYVQVREKFNMDSETKIFDVTVQFFPQVDIKEEYGIQPQTLEKRCETEFMRQLAKQLKLKTKKSSSTIGQAVPTLNSDAQMNTTEMAMDEEDSLEQKINSQSKYLGYGTEKSDVRNEDMESSEDESNAKSNSDSDSDTDSESDNIESNYSKIGNDRILAIKMLNSHVTGFQFDTKRSLCQFRLEYMMNAEKMLMNSIVERACSTTIIQEIPGIRRAQVSAPSFETEKDQASTIITEGANFQQIWRLDESLFDLNKLRSNDIAKMLKSYGVEACRATIMNEISSVFDVYGIQVDKRHLTLIADYMTFHGGFQPFNRLGLDSNSNPFAKMSFETTCHFLTQATLHSEKDYLINPSSQLVMGKLAQVGTGLFHVLSTLSGAV